MDLTVISRNEYNNIARTAMSSKEAYDYLNSKFHVRTFLSTLEKFSGSKNIKQVLEEKLCLYNPDANKASLQKKISGWLSGKYEPSDRETLFQICFAFELNDSEAEDFLAYSSDSSFHYRNILELTYAFALKTGLDYFEARSLYESLPKTDPSMSDEAEDGEAYTETLYNEFYKVKTPEEFTSFINRNLKKFGVLHNTAYGYLMSFINCLKDPDEDMYSLFGDGDCKDGKSSKLSIEAVTEEYLRMNVPSGTGAGKMSHIGKIVRRYWPSATSMKNMCNRTEDVKRKILILLYIITEGIAPDVNYDFVIDEGLTDEERFCEHYDRLCIMLTDCGFSLPDPRNIFDWVALYAVKMNNDEEMSSELESILDRIFEAENELSKDI